MKLKLLILACCLWAAGASAQTNTFVAVPFIHSTSLVSKTGSTKVEEPTVLLLNQQTGDAWVLEDTFDGRSAEGARTLSWKRISGGPSLGEARKPAPAAAQRAETPAKP